jgi:hypothetical protein
MVDQARQDHASAAAESRRKAREAMNEKRQRAINGLTEKMAQQRPGAETATKFPLPH